MAGSEIEYLSISSLPAAARTKDLTALEPGDEDCFVRIRNAERFAVHFFCRDFEIGVNALCNRVAGVADPYSFLLAYIAPDQ